MSSRDRLDAPGPPSSSSSSVLEAFLSAGFCQDDARRGVQMLESGLYIDFTDAADSLRRLGFSTLGRDNRPVAPGVTEARIVAAARRLSERSGAGD